VRLTRAIWGLLAIMLLASGITTWYLTRPEGPEPPWLGVVGVADVLAGDGRNGWRDGPAGEARFSEPFGVAVAPDGIVHVSDAGESHRLRRIARDGTVTTLAGARRGFADGRGVAARFSTPSAIAVAPDGTLYVADTGNHAIRRVTPDGVVTTVAGDGIAGYVDGPATQARFNGPVGVTVDDAGRVIVADTYNDRIRIIDAGGEVRTLAGGDLPGYADGSPLEVRFDTPCGVAVDGRGRILVADTGNGLVRRIDPDGTVSTVPLSQSAPATGPGVEAAGPTDGDPRSSPIIGLERPIAVASGPGGDLYVVDERGEVVLIPARGDARLLAGNSVAGFANGVGGGARFRRPSGIAIGREAGRAHARIALVVADAGNALVRRVEPLMARRRRSTAGLLTPWLAPAPPLVAPPPRRIDPTFDVDTFARTPLIWPIAPLEGPHEVAGTFAEARGEEGQERFHAGLDVREVQGTPVHAVRDGIVASPISTGAFDTLNEYVRIGELAYVHIRVGRGSGTSVQTAGSESRPYQLRGGLSSKAEGRLPKAEIDLDRFAPVYDADGTLLRMRVKRGAFFATGDVVGSINRFNHVHLNVGWAGEEHNPLRFRLVQFVDTIRPTIAAHGVRLFDETGQPLNPDRVAAAPARRRGRARRPRRLPPVEPVIVRGRVRIIVDAWDQAEGNIPSRRLGVYALGYQVLARDERPVAGFESPRVTLQFDRMPLDRTAPRQVYAGGSGIPVYGANRTQFLYVVTTTYRDGVATPGWWDTTSLAPGEYVLRVFCEDFSGNRTTRDLRVVVPPGIR
jgi:sugar lactone lactonase YvrE